MNFQKRIGSLKKDAVFSLDGYYVWCGTMTRGDDGLYYLFVTYTDCARDNYCNTMVFYSQDPKRFGIFDGDKGDLPITVLKAHAPEIIEENDKYYITTCGWRSYPNPHEGAVSIAPLDWKEL